MNISVTDALPLFTNHIVSKYSDHHGVMSYGRSFFIESAVATKLLSYLSQRGLKLIASDVERGSRGNLNVFDKSTQNIMMPPFYNEFFNITELDSYDALMYDLVGGKINPIRWGLFIDEVAAKLKVCMDKIDRRYELQCWQALLTGIVTIANGLNIKLGRAAGSLVDPGAGNYWDAKDPFLSFRRGATWLNETGKMSGNKVLITMGQDAFGLYVDNADVKARNLQLKNNMDNLVPAIRDSTGKTYQGETSDGSFVYHFFTYTDWYEDEAGTKTKFMDSKKIVMVPEMHKNTLTYAGIPQRITKGTTPVAAKFHTWQAVSEFGDGEYVGVKSAGLAQLGAVDQVYTEKVVA
jgi:hypothetical protein